MVSTLPRLLYMASRVDIFHTGGIGWDRNNKITVKVKGQG